MFKVVITEKAGAQRTLDFDKGEVTIGRVQGNDIILPKGNVSKRHSRIVLKDNRFIVVDLKSTNGTYVNGRKITSPLVVKSGDKIYIGDFILTLEEPSGAGAGAGAAPAPTPAAAPAPAPAAAPNPNAPNPTPVVSPAILATLPPGPGPGPGQEPAVTPAGNRPPPLRSQPPNGSAAATRPATSPRAAAPSEPPPAVPPGGERFALDEDPADETVAPHLRVVGRPAGAQPRLEPPPPLPPREPEARPEPQKAAAAAPVSRSTEEARARSAEAPRSASAERAPAAAPVERVVERIVERAPEAPRALEPAAPDPAALGPLAELLEEVGVLEVVVEGAASIFVDRGQGLQPSGARFASNAAVLRAVHQLFAQAATPIVPTAPVQEATLADGAHVTAVLPPVAMRGPYVEVRRVGRPPISGETLLSQGMLSLEMLTTLRNASASRRNIVVVGAEDSGVPALISALVAATDEQRLVAVESTPELALASPRAVRLAAGSTSFSGLIERASRMRADRLIIDGVRGAEAREALVALAARGGATILGVRAVAHSAVLEHLEAIASLGSSREGIATLIGSAVHIVVRMATGKDGVKRVESVSELGVDGLVPLFEFGEQGFAATGNKPSF